MINMRHSILMNPDTMQFETLATVNPKESPQVSATMKTSTRNQYGAATPNLAKFKAAQDLKISIEAIPIEPALQTSQHGLFTCAVTPKTPGPPSSTGKKRRRRTAAQIDRKYPCNYPGCNKAYGSDGSLTQHQRLKHRNQFHGGLRRNQLGSFFLPFHRAGQNGIGSVPRTGSTRNVNIRPATVDGLLTPVGAVESPGVSTSLPIATDLRLNVGCDGGHRQLRTRSNSMPMSFDMTLSMLNSGGNKSRPQSTRRGRHAVTPKVGGSARKAKARSKSECVGDFDLFDAINQDRPNLPDRSMSDPGFDWSLAARNSESFSSEDAIDSDILSILADCDASDSTECEIDLLQDTLPNDAKKILSVQTNCYKICEESPLIITPLDEEIKLVESPKVKEEASSSFVDAMYLSSHMEKMTMLSPHHGSTIHSASNSVGDDTSVSIRAGDFVSSDINMKNSEHVKSLCLNDEWMKDFNIEKEFTNAAFEMEVDLSSTMPMEWNTLEKTPPHGTEKLLNPIANVFNENLQFDGIDFVLEESKNYFKTSPILCQSEDL